jgi:hypothetical protein
LVPILEQFLALFSGCYLLDVVIVGGRSSFLQIAGYFRLIVFEVVFLVWMPNGH